MTEHSVSPLGAYVSLQDMIALRFSAPQLSRRSGRATSGLTGGNHQTRLRGRGLEFVEVRPYQAGDDIRTIDWRVTARSSITHTRLYAEERERPVMLLCDQRSSMFFGSRLRFKSVQAASLASLLGWSAHRHGDRVGGLVMGRELMWPLRPKASSRHVLQLLKQIDDFNHQLAKNDDSSAEPALAEALAELRRIARPGTAVFLISDFHDFDDAAIDQLFQMSRHCDVNLLAVYDPLEADLPARGFFRVSTRNETVAVNAANKTSRRKYTSSFEQRQQHLAAQCGRLGISYAKISTTEDPITFITSYILQGGSRP